MNNINKIIREQEILHEAVKAFRLETSLRIKEGLFDANEGNKKVDTKLRLGVKGQMHDFLIEIKPALNEPFIGTFALAVADNPETWLIVTRYVPPYLAKKMKELGLQFIDTVGNIYINKPPLYVFTHGNKLPKIMQEAGENRIFGLAEVKVVFALLCEQGLVNRTYREIALAANAALGTVAQVVKNLTRQGFIINLGAHTKKLVRKKELVDRWIIAYAGRLRPKTLIGKYYTEVENFNTTLLMKYGVQIGGENAIMNIAGYLKPGITTFYAERPINELILALKLRTNEYGNVEIRERFWNLNAFEKDNIVPRVLIYADLLATANDRNIEAAKHLYENHLQKYILND